MCSHYYYDTITIQPMSLTSNYKLLYKCVDTEARVVLPRCQYRRNANSLCDSNVKGTVCGALLKLCAVCSFTVNSQQTLQSDR